MSATRRTFFGQVFGGLLAAVGVKTAPLWYQRNTRTMRCTTHIGGAQYENALHEMAMEHDAWTAGAPNPPDFWKRGPEFE